MYNLLITAQSHAWDRSGADWEAERYREFTSDYLSDRLDPAKVDLAAELCSWPCIFAYESYVNAPAQIGWMTSILFKGRTTVLAFEMDSSMPAMDPNQLIELQGQLDIRSFEFSRTHWAVKDVDLGQVLLDAKIISEPQRVKLMQRPGLRGLANAQPSRSQRPMVTGKFGVPGFAPTPASLPAHGVPANHESIAQQPVSGALPAAIHAAVAPQGVQGTSAPFESFAGHAGIQETLMPSQQSRPSARNPRVFIVHGRDDLLKLNVARFLDKIGIDAVILHEQTDGGRTIIAKFEKVAGDVDFAVVLMTPDDEGCLKGGASKPRARQNVIFELGFFLAKLGSEKVRALVQGDVEKPSDIDGVIYIPADDDGWKTKLAKELKASGIEADYVRVIDL